MTQALVLLVSPFALNGLTAVVNLVLGIQSASLKRVVLAVLSLVGIVSISVATGAPIDPTSVSNVVQVLGETFVTFLLGHGSYHLFFKSSTPTAQ